MNHPYDGAERLDFRRIRESADFPKVLEHFGALAHMASREGRLVGRCPIGRRHGRDDSFSVDLAAGRFRCQSCRARGDVIDFAAACRGAGLRDAATAVRAIMDASADRAPSPPPAVPDRRPVMDWPEATRLVESGDLLPDGLLVVDTDAIRAGRTT